MNGPSRVILAALAMAAVVGPAGGQERALLQQAFAGTIVSTYPDGRTGRLHLHPDGSYDGLGRRGDVSGGTWSLTSGRICMKQRKPFWYPIAYCTPIASGTTWQAKAPTGEAIHVHLQTGR